MLLLHRRLPTKEHCLRLQRASFCRAIWFNPRRRILVHHAPPPSQINALLLMLEPISGHMALVLDIQSPNISASNATAACLSLNQGNAAHFFKWLIAPETLKTERCNHIAKESATVLTFGINHYEWIAFTKIKGLALAVIVQCRYRQFLYRETLPSFLASCEDGCWQLWEPIRYTTVIKRLIMSNRWVIHLEGPFITTRYSLESLTWNP